MDFGNYLRFVLALLFVLGLIGVFAALLRRYGVGMASAPMRKGAKRRLQVVEVLALDAKRRAVLMRRDDVEHLVVLGPDQQTVVETGIAPSHQEDSHNTFADVLERNVQDDRDASPPKAEDAT